MLGFNRSIGAETRLPDFPRFTDAHIARALSAAKNSQLKMKLRNMPVPLRADQADEYMAPVLEAARTGTFRHTKSPILRGIHCEHPAAE